MGNGKVELKSSKELEIPEEVASALVFANNRLKKLANEEFVEDELYAPCMHLLKNQGKMIRPGLLFSSALILGKKPMDYIDLAAGIELLHTASLIHDDIVDKDAVRRGRDAVHVKYGTEKAVLAGDALIAKAIDFASAYGALAVKRASQAAMDMCAGEILDYNVQSGKQQLDLHGYLRIAQLKSASLIATSTSIVADCIGSDTRDMLYEIGLNIGYSFQLRDDILNHTGTSSDKENSRPNIVAVLEAHNKENPLKTAVKLNNFYVDRAAELLYGLNNNNTALFEYYLKFLALEI